MKNFEDISKTIIDVEYTVSTGFQSETKSFRFCCYENAINYAEKVAASVDVISCVSVISAYSGEVFREYDEAGNIINRHD